MDKKASLQKESEWEKDFEEFFSNTTDRSKFCEFISYREVKDFIKDVESSAEQRGREEVSGEYALSLIPEEKDMSNESIKLHTFSEAGFILGWNACRKAMIDKVQDCVYGLNLNVGGKEYKEILGQIKNSIWLRGEIQRALSKAVTAAVAKRELEIAEEVKKKITRLCFVHSAGGLGGWKHLDDILNEIILKH